MIGALSAWRARPRSPSAAPSTSMQRSGMNVQGIVDLSRISGV
jgi:hypothetical protein